MKYPPTTEDGIRLRHTGRGPNTRRDLNVKKLIKISELFFPCLLHAMLSALWEFMHMIPKKKRLNYQEPKGDSYKKQKLKCYVTCPKNCTISRVNHLFHAIILSNTLLLCHDAINSLMTLLAQLQD